MPVNPKRPVTHIIPGRLTPEESEARDKYRELQRCIRSSWYLATEYMGYGWNEARAAGLTERIHEPICKWHDRHRREKKLAIWIRRGGYKSTLLIVWATQEILEDPTRTHRYWHEVNEHAGTWLDELASHFRSNERLRWLDPVGQDPVTGMRYNIFPTKANTKWYRTAQGSSGIKLHTGKRFGAGTRSPTMRAQGRTGAVVGAHINGTAWLDDVIGQQTIENSEVHKVASWYEQSVIPLVDSRRIRFVGTLWPGATLYKEVTESKQWRNLIVPGAITETDEEFKAKIEADEMNCRFAADYSFTNPVMLTKELRAQAVKNLEDDQLDMKGNFGPQIMMDDEPESEKFWSQSACEHFCGMSEKGGIPGAMDGTGITVVLMDPAPLHSGSYKGLGEKQRMDGTKDWWSIAVVRIRVRVALRERILLDGRHSLEWTEDQGCDVVCSLLKKWRTNLFVSEDPDAWHDRMILASRRNGTPLRRADDGGPLKFQIYNKAQRKIGSFSALSAAARDGLFYVLDTCSAEYLYGDLEHTGFLTQMRKVRRISYADKSRTNLRWDDDADVVARSGDTLFDEIAPKSDKTDDQYTWSPFRPNEPEEVQHGSRYVRW